MTVSSLMTAIRGGRAAAMARTGAPVLAALGIGLAVLVATLFYYGAVAQFERSKREEALTVLRLVNAFGSLNDQAGRGGSDRIDEQRLRAIAAFNASQAGADAPRLDWIELRQRRAVRSSADEDNAARFRLDVDPAAVAEPVSLYVETEGGTVFRTLHPSFDPSVCADCERRLDGALALDVPADAFLRRTAGHALLAGLFVLLLAAAGGCWALARRDERESERRALSRLGAAIDAMRDGFALYDRHRRLLLANAAHLRNTGAVGAACGDTVRLEGGAWIKVQETTTPDGDIVRIETDISALKEREAELNAAKEAAESANRSKSEFLALMSHELRTPLNAINGFSEVLCSQLFGPIDARYRSYAKDIHESGQHLLNVINDILDLSKAEAGRMELVCEITDVAEVVESSLRLLRARAAEASIQLQSQVQRDLVISADERRLKQIIINLATNAVKFTPAGGRVDVTARTDRDGRFVLRVADTGIGMSEEDIPKALAPFQQVDGRLSRKYEGTGLGLPLTKALVELHGGRLTITSKPGSGTTVAVTLAAERVLAMPRRATAG